MEKKKFTKLESEMVDCATLVVVLTASVITRSLHLDTRIAKKRRNDNFTVTS